MPSTKKTAVQKSDSKSTQNFPFIDLCNINILMDKDNKITSAGIDFDTGRHSSHNSLQGKETMEIHYRGKVYVLSKCLDPDTGYESWFHQDLPIFSGNIEHVGHTKTGKERWKLKLQMAKSLAE